MKRLAAVLCLLCGGVAWAGQGAKGDVDVIKIAGNGANAYIYTKTAMRVANSVAIAFSSALTGYPNLSVAGRMLYSCDFATAVYMASYPFPAEKGAAGFDPAQLSLRTNLVVPAMLGNTNGLDQSQFKSFLAKECKKPSARQELDVAVGYRPSTDSVVIVHVASIKSAGVLKEFWAEQRNALKVPTVPSELVKDGARPPAGVAQIRYAAGEHVNEAGKYRVDCAAAKLAVLDLTTYQANGAVKQAWTDTSNGRQPHFIDITPGSIAEAQANLVCSI